MEERPYPHDVEIGGIHEFQTRRGDWEAVHWWCRFEHLDGGKWACHYLAGLDPVPGLSGTGDSPREAFESLINRWSLTNGGYSEALAALLPGMRAMFSEDGQMLRPEQLDTEPTAM